MQFATINVLKKLRSGYLSQSIFLYTAIFVIVIINQFRTSCTFKHNPLIKCIILAFINLYTYYYFVFLFFSFVNNKKNILFSFLFIYIYLQFFIINNIVNKIRKIILNYSHKYLIIIIINNNKNLNNINNLLVVAKPSHHEEMKKKNIY